jgi:hypothetical protein
MNCKCVFVICSLSTQDNDSVPIKRVTIMIISCINLAQWTVNATSMLFNTQSILTQWFPALKFQY